MHFQFHVAQTAAPEGALTESAPELANLLREILETQREQLQLMRAQMASHDAGGRWRAFLERWKDDFGTLPGACKQVLPDLERAYMNLIAELAAHLNEQGEDCTGNEFALGEFLDRYGMRLNQLGSILSLVGPLAEIAAADKK